MFNITAGLGWSFVPPYGPWSTLACGDCHQSGDAADPVGPHGSDNPWILREINFNAAVDNNLDGDTVDTVDYINTSSGVPGDSTGWTATAAICYSCHRRDVYGIDNGGTRATGDPAFPAGTTNHTTRYSRVSDGHPPGSSALESNPVNNAFGIWCLNCHGGETATAGNGIGAIHGSNRGTGTSGTAAMGLRLRNGAGSVGHTVGTTTGACWTKGATDAVNSCVQGHTGTGYNATYNYTGVD